MFVHIPKTAGQSIEHVFLRLLGLDWQTRAPLLLRANDQPRLGPPRLAHLRAADYVRCCYLTQALYNAHFVFCFVRDPWDRAASLHRYLGYASSHTLTDFLAGPLREAVQARHWFVLPQSEFILADGQLLVDFVGRFEQLQADFDRVSERLTLPRQPLPWVNASRPEQPSPRAVWTETAIEIVRELYGDDASRFGYAAPAPAPGAG